jgi:hypothetical protein
LNKSQIRGFLFCFVLFFGILKISEVRRKKFLVSYRTKSVGIENKSPLITSLHLKYLGINFERCAESFFRKFNYLIRRYKGKFNKMKKNVRA